MPEINLTILVDDLNGAELGYIKSFGFSILIETHQRKVLFDTDTKEKVLLANLTKYGTDPSSLDAVILSHNHYDHTNGLSGLLRINEDLPVYVHKYWEKKVKHIGDSIPLKNKIVIENGRKLSELGKEFYITNAYQSPDYGGIYEQACYVQTKDSFLLICGCSHPGLLCFLNDREFLKIPINSFLHIIGGFHSFTFDIETVHLLDSYIRSVIVCHCTKNVDVYRNQFKNKFTLGTVGKTLKF
ncbi:MAG: MBL fold metallo-hydrolase [Promethearchaeota archaeon]